MTTQDQIKTLSDYFEKQKIRIISANLTKTEPIKNIQIQNSIGLQDILFLTETLQLKPEQLKIDSAYEEGIEDSVVILIWKEV